METSGPANVQGDERRVVARRASPERRFAERRQPERAVVGRRTDFVPDRRVRERRALRPEFAG
jgi:hypothetical protein